MKTPTLILGLSLALLCSATNSQAWQKVGAVYCDANNNNMIDPGDLPVPGVLVVVTNLSGTFSNASVTTAQGVFVIPLPDTPDSYVDFISPATLPPGTTAVLPPFNAFTTSASTTTVTNRFLIQNPACVEEEAGRCWLTGGGTFRNGQGQPTFSFGGVVNPGCSPTAAGGGNWNVIWHTANLHFKGLEIEVTQCGNLPGIPPGSTSPVTPFNFIDFEGVGTLKGTGRNRANYGLVFFTGRAVDAGEPGRADRLYLRVYNGAGQTLLLISANPGSPTTVAPRTISTGNLQIHVSGCD